MSNPSNPSPATHWQSLLPAAMVGTEKMAFTAPALSGPVGALLAQIEAQQAAQPALAQPALALLQMAGVLAVCERAARQGQASAASAPNSAAPETAPALHAKGLQLSLRWALAEAPPRLQIELLQRLSAAGLRLPTGLLALALEAGQRSVALRPALLPVLGERGMWLARHNSYWRYASGTAASAPLETRWSEGSLAQRVELLREQRQLDPASARERLKTALPDLPAKDRAELAAVLIEGLSMDDEALLVALCKDRGADVRQTARALLVQLPDSAQTQRAIARLQPCLEKPSTLKSLLGAKWKIQAPEAAGDDWKADGLEAERPKFETMGERAWWLYQLARQVPLDWWTQHTGLTPDALVQWAAKGDWNEALVRAWLDVLRTAPDAAWCRAFLDHWPGKALKQTSAVVLALLPPAQREPYWMQTLQQISPKNVDGFTQLINQILQACPPGEQVSPALSGLLLEKLPLYLKKYYIDASLAELCCVLHSDMLPGLVRPPSEDDPLAYALRNHQPVIAARRAFSNLTPAVIPS